MKIWFDTNISTHAFIPVSYWEKKFQEVKEAILDAEVYVYEKGDRLLEL